MATDQRNPDRLARLGMLAWALSGRTLRVAPVEPGEPAWTDGATVFVDADATARHRLEALAVQASLLAAGSLEPGVLRVLRRRPALARRYLAVEGHRALAANEDLLPSPVRGLVDSDLAGRGDSPAASLAVASSRQAIPDPPECFGTLRARKVLAAARRHARTAEWLEDDDDTGGEDAFASPVGGRGALGRLLGRMLRAVRRLGEGGQPGADAPTHRTRSGIRGATAALSTAPAGQVDDQPVEGQGIAYPEWDFRERRYRSNWCTVREVEPAVTSVPSPDSPDGYGLRRPLARLGLGPDWFHRQVQGDDIDIDAAIEARVAAAAGSLPEEAVYIAPLRRRRDLSVLLLLDVSGSVAEPGTHGKTVHEQQRAAAAALAVSFHALGDRLALYAFHSQGRSCVHVMPVKRFDDDLNALASRRLRGLVPGAYSRLGAAIRHGAAVLESRGGTSRRLLVVLSDGLAYDHGYERAYGAADARRALAEARGRGVGCVCLTIGAGTDPEELQRVFGSAAHATIARPEQLSQVVGPLFRTALRSAEVRRPETRGRLSQISVPRYAAASRAAR
ncbi:nitric oxide reductase activation protein [Mycobacterium malmoense]|uniref:Nitric oxide reductase activation protein n=2 Tax=Mycobacterium malmoense TaxID=1780 RepID=A0ABX3SRG6_MYCMA|nr:nitric oxide reductase activation protein [Mycobacterium malmoense]